MKDLQIRLEKETKEDAHKMIYMWIKQNILSLKEYQYLVKKLTIPVVSKSFCNNCKSGLIDYPEINRRTCRCGALGYNV